MNLVLAPDPLYDLIAGFFRGFILGVHNEFGEIVIGVMSKEMLIHFALTV